MRDLDTALGLDDSPERDEFRKRLAASARAEGLLLPVTDEEIERFEREHGRGPAVSEAFIAAMTARVLERLHKRPSAKALRLRPLWSSAAAAAVGLIAAMHRNEGDEADPEAERRLEEHRRRLRDADESLPGGDAADE